MDGLLTESSFAGLFLREYVMEGFERLAQPAIPLLFSTHLPIIETLSTKN